MLPARITFPQVSISALMRASNSSGVLATVSKPGVLNLSLVFSDATIFGISRCKNATIAFGVLRDCPTSDHSRFFRRIAKTLLADHQVG
jgi:hypothetical protein